MRARYAFVVLALMMFLLAGAAIVFTVTYYHREQGAQQQQGQEFLAKLCGTLEPLAALKPPAGNAADNPSRAYEQQLAAKLAQLGPDVGCRP